MSDHREEIMTLIDEAEVIANMVAKANELAQKLGPKLTQIHKVLCLEFEESCDSDPEEEGNPDILQQISVLESMGDSFSKDGFSLYHGSFRADQISALEKLDDFMVGNADYWRKKLNK